MNIVSLNNLGLEQIENRTTDFKDISPLLSTHKYLQLKSIEEEVKILMLMTR